MELSSCRSSVSPGGSGRSRSTSRCFFLLARSLRRAMEATRLRAVTAAYGARVSPSTRACAAITRVSVSWTRSSTTCGSRIRELTILRTIGTSSTMTSSASASASSRGYVSASLTDPLPSTGRLAYVRADVRADVGDEPPESASPYRHRLGRMRAPTGASWRDDAAAGHLPHDGGARLAMGARPGALGRRPLGALVGHPPPGRGSPLGPRRPAQRDRGPRALPRRDPPGPPVDGGGA